MLIGSSGGMVGACMFIVILSKNISEVVRWVLCLGMCSCYRSLFVRFGFGTVMRENAFGFEYW